MTSSAFDFPRGRSINESKASDKTFVKRKSQPFKIYRKDEDLFKVHKRKSDEIDGEISGLSNKKYKRKTKQSAGDDEEEVKVIIELMSLATLPENMVVYGCIQEISDYEIKLCIAGGIVVKVGIINISDAYTQLLENFAINLESMTDTEVLKPSGMFEIGQYFPVKIMQKSNCETFGNLDITASLNPTDIYSDIIPSYFLRIPNMVIVAAVESIEDHGYVMNVGLNGVKAFLSKDKAQSAIQSIKGRKALSIGQLVYCAIDTVNERTITLTTKPKLLSNFKFTSEMNVSLSCMLPGIKVCATVMNVNEKGIALNILDEYTGFVTRNHLKSDWDLPKNSYSIGDKIEGTVLYVNPITKQIALTMKPNLSPKEVSNYWKNLKIGLICENAEVEGRDQMGSIVFRLPNNIKAIARRKHLFDKKFTEMEDFDFDTKFAIGSKHKCRVCSINFMDRSINITLRESLLEIPSVFIDDLKIGSIIRGTVKSMNKNGVTVQIGFALKGFIPNMHLTDAPNKLNREKSFTKGKQVKCRVIKIDRNTTPNKVCLTRKKSLLNKGLTIFEKYETITKESKTDGVVVLILKKGLLIEFFNNIKGFIPLKYLSTYHIEYPEKVFRIGQIVKCSVVNVNAERERMTCSLIDYKESKNKNNINKPKLTVGQLLLNMKITNKTDNGFDLTNETSDITAYMPFGYLSDDVYMCNQLSNVLIAGDIIDEVVVFNIKAHFVIVCRKQTFITATKNQTLIRTYDQLEPNLVVPAIINGIVSYGIFVELPANIKGLVPKRFLTDGPLEEPHKLGFQLKQTVYVKFIEFENKLENTEKPEQQQKKKLVFSLRLNHVWNKNFDDRIFMLNNYLNDLTIVQNSIAKNQTDILQRLAEFEIGQVVHYRIVNIDSEEVVCDVTVNNRKNEKSVKGVCFKRSLDSEHEHKVGNVGIAVILGIDFNNKQLEIMIHKTIVKQVKNALKNNAISTIKLDQVIKCTSIYICEFYVIALLAGHAPGVIVYIPTKRHYNDISGLSSLFTLMTPYQVTVKSISRNKIIAVINSDKETVNNFKSYKANKLQTFYNKRDETKQETEAILEVKEVISEEPRPDIILISESPEKIKKKKKESNKKLKTDINPEAVNEPKPQEKINVKPIVNVIEPKQIDAKQEDTKVNKHNISLVSNQSHDNNISFRRNVLRINEEFKWNVDDATPNLNDVNSFVQNYDSSSDNFSDDSDIASADKNAPKRKKSRKERNEEVRQREEMLRKKEEMMIDKDRKPETVDDFELSILASPNSSLVWLKYMAYHLENAEIIKARAVGHKALDVISFREEQEKLNVYVALLNLENLYGDGSSLDEIFHRALQHNEPITIYKHLANIYAQSNKLESAEALYDTMLKKFKRNKEIWINFGLFYMKNNRKESARKLMQRSLTCLDNRDHIDVISKFAQMEFRFGDVEHGKTLFDNIFANFSKRTDLWSVYIDMLVKFTLNEDRKVEAIDFIRNIFEKVITLKFAAKKMKFFFKRYIDFENQFGDEERITRIRQKALEYVETKTID